MRRGIGVSALRAFDRWFASSGGVWQTLAVCLAVVVVEFCDPRLDPHAFLLMAILTVYSAVTQPALAHTGAEAAERQAEMLALLRQLLEHAGADGAADLATDRQQLAILQALAHHLGLDVEVTP